MCVIIDANVASKAFKFPATGDAIPLLRWITDHDGKTVYGGRHAEELAKLKNAARMLAALSRAGRAIRVSDLEVNAEEQIVKKTCNVVSDDSHILALARVSGARVLYSEDEALWDDFRDPTIISKPRGRIYRRSEHKLLLRHDSSCRYATARKPSRRRFR